MKYSLWGALCPLFFTHSQILSKDRFSGWPTVAINSKNVLFIGYSGDRIRHCDPYGKNFLISSHDLGKTWGAAKLVNDSELDNRDAGLLFLPDDTLLYSFFTSDAFKTSLKRMVEAYGTQILDEWKEDLEKQHDEKPASYLVIYDKDCLSNPIVCPVSSPHGPILGLDQTIYYLGNRTDNYDLALYKSKDGKEWVEVAQLFPAKIIPKHLLCEPHLIQLSEDTFLALFRANHKKPRSRVLFKSLSFDGGKTWTHPESTPILGTPPHLLKLKNGNILLTYGYRSFPYSIRARVSTDNGKTWEKEIILAYKRTSDLGYPSTVELPDGSFFTVYYADPTLYSVHWKV